MAHAKTSIAQLLAQGGVGIVVASVFYRSFVSVSSPTESTRNIEGSIESESRKNTTGKIWGIPSSVNVSESDQNQTNSKKS